MTWYYLRHGIHVHVLVFLNGAKCGELVFRQDEFDFLKTQAGEDQGLITFIDRKEDSQ